MNENTYNTSTPLPEGYKPYAYIMDEDGVLEYADEDELQIIFGDNIPESVTSIDGVPCYPVPNVTTMEEVNYYVGLIGLNERRAREIEEAYNSEIKKHEAAIARLVSEREISVRPWNGRCAFIMRTMGQVLSLTVRKFLGETKETSVKLPAGRVGMYTVRKKIVIHDSDKAVEWAKVYAPESIEHRVLSSLISDEALKALGDKEVSGMEIVGGFKRFEIHASKSDTD